MALKKNSKSPANPEGNPAVPKLSGIASLEGVQDIITHLQKGDFSGMVGAMMTLWKEHFGTPEEKAEIAKNKQESKVKNETKAGLKTLKTDVDEGEGHEHDHDHVHEEGEKELVKNPELGDGREYAVIGDSAAKGMYLSYDAGKKPGFIGKVGFSTGEVLRRLKAERNKLKGKKKAVIYCAGNNILGTSTDKLVSHMVEMAQICHAEKVPEIIVNSQFPPIANYVKNIGPKKFAELKKRNTALLEGLKKAYKEGRFPSGTKLVDLTTPFSNDKNEMKAEFVDTKTTDYLHPWKAYKPALNHMMS